MIARFLSVSSRHAGQLAVIKKDYAWQDHAWGLIRNTHTLVSPGTERAFALGWANTPKKWPYAPGYSAVGVNEHDGVVYHRGIHASAECTRSWIKVPSVVLPIHASFTALGQVAIQAVRKAKLEPNGEVLVIGGGLLGQLICRVAFACGAGRVWLDSSVPEFDRRAELCGATPTRTQEPSAQDWATTVIECGGDPLHIGYALRKAAHRARVVLAGSTRGDPKVSVYRDIHKKQLTIVGAHGMGDGDEQRRSDEEFFLALLASRRVSVGELITDVVPWRKLIPAYRRMLEMKGKPILGMVIDWRGA